MAGRNYLKFILTLIFSCCIFSSWAQILDTLKASLKQPLKFYFSLDLSQSFGASSGTDITGIKLGAEQNQRIYYSAGYYIFNTDVIKNKIVRKSDGADTIVPAQLKLRFITLGGEYVFFRSDKAQIGIPVNIGYGKSYFEYFMKKGDRAKTSRTGSALFSASIDGNYKITSWLGLGLGIGHASTLGTNRNEDQNFHAWTYNFGVQLYFDEIYHAITDSNKQKKTDDHEQELKPEF